MLLMQKILQQQYIKKRVSEMIIYTGTFSCQYHINYANFM